MNRRNQCWMSFFCFSYALKSIFNSNFSCFYFILKARIKWIVNWNGRNLCHCLPLNIAHAGKIATLCFRLCIFFYFISTPFIFLSFRSNILCTPFIINKLKPNKNPFILIYRTVSSVFALPLCSFVAVHAWKKM